MRLATITLAGAMFTGVLAVGACMPAAMAEQATEGMITGINRLNGTVAIQQTPGGTVGANAPASEQFKVQDGALLESVHAGDRVTFSVTESGGVKTITKLQRAKP
jgi:Cu/Ag efflux protein CusF